MKIEGIKVANARRDLLALNEQFWSGKLVGQGFYNQLGLQGCDFRRSVLIEICPDGGGSYFGRVIAQNGKVIQFDVVIGASEYSRWLDKTSEFRSGIESKRRRKPWDLDVLALDLFNSVLKSATPGNN